MAGIQTLAAVVESAARHEIAELKAGPAGSADQAGTRETQTRRRLMVMMMMLQARGIRSRANMSPHRQLAIQFWQGLYRRNLNINIYIEKNLNERSS
jgi:hypothetical protein